MTEPIRILGVDVENVGQPRNDGSRGSGLYAVPIRLSRAPSAREAEWLVHFWDNPGTFSSMHRPGIARVSGTSLILDGTTIDEVRDVHVTTVKLAVDSTNTQYAVETEVEDRRRAAEDESREAHEANVRKVAAEIRFD